MNKQDLKSKIEKLEKGIASKVTPENLKGSLKSQKEKFEKELSDLEKKDKSNLSKKIKDLKATVKTKSTNSSLSRDGARKAKKSGKRVSADGSVYYEKRANRTDSQTKKKPYLEKGGELEGMIANIYRSDYDSPTNKMYGKKSVTIIDKDVPKIFEPNESRPAVRLIRRKLGAVNNEYEYIYAIPYNQPEHRGMFGGTFIYSSDSRFPAKFPIPLHDRVEDYEKGGDLDMESEEFKKQMIKNHKETAEHYEKMLQKAEKVGQSDWDIEQIKKMVAFHKTMANEYKSDKMGKGGLTKTETLEVAEKFAKALSKTENKKVTVNMRTLEEDSFDLDMDGIEYDGGSYNIYDNGDVKNMALKESPVYGKTTSNQAEIEKNLSKMAKGGSISKKYTVNVYYGGEMKDEEFHTDSLDEAKQLSQKGEHSEIYDNMKKEFVEMEYVKGGETESYEVELSAESNPDYDKSSHEGSINIKSHKVKAKSIENARDIVMSFIMENDLGGGNWSGGNVYKNGKKIGHVSYNGRYWDDTKMAKGGETNYTKKWRAVYITLQGKRGTKEITLGRLSDKDDVRNALRRMSDLNIREVTLIEEIKEHGGYMAKGGDVEEDVYNAYVVWIDDNDEAFFDGGWNSIEDAEDRVSDIDNEEEGNPKYSVFAVEYDENYFENKNWDITRLKSYRPYGMKGERKMAEGGMMADGGMVSLSKHYKTLGKKDDLVGLKVYDKSNDEFVYIKNVDSGIFAGKNKNDELGHNYSMSELMVQNMEHGGYMADGGSVGQNMYVFGYTTQNFDLCPLAVEEFEKAINIIGQTDSDAKKTALSRAAMYVDDVLGVEKRAKEENIVSKNEFQYAVTQSLVASAYNYASGLEVNLTKFLPMHIFEIATKLVDIEDAKKDELTAYDLLLAKDMVGEQAYKNMTVEERKNMAREAKNSFEHGGSVQESNYRMVLSQAKAIKHHADELMEVLNPDMEVEAWVVGKIERASTDMSDITHYLDGLVPNAMDEEVNNSFEEGGQLEKGVYYLGKPKKEGLVWTQKIVELDETGLSFATDYARKLKDFPSKDYKKLTEEELSEFIKKSPKHHNVSSDPNKFEHYANGGMIAGRYYRDNQGIEYRYIGEDSTGKSLFSDGQRVSAKSFDEFENQFMAHGGKIYSGKDIKITIPKMGKFDEQKVVAVYDKDNFIFKIYDKDKKRVLTKMGGTNFESNLMNGSYKMDGYMAKGGVVEIGSEGMYRGGAAKVLKYDDKNKMYAIKYLNQNGEVEGNFVMAKKDDFEYGFSDFNPKMAEGGMTEHGLRIGDKVTTDLFWDNQIVVENQKTHKKAQINLETGQRKDEMAMGGKVKFEDKVKAIKASLLKKKKVSPNVQKDYGKTYSPKEAEDSAKRIVGSRLKKAMK